MRPVIIILLFILAVLLLPGISFSLSNVSNCSVLSVPDTYVLNRSLNGSPNDATPFGDGACMRISSSNVILDCNGYNITGNTSVGTNIGVLINGPFTNVSVRNCRAVSGYDYGIAFNGSNDSFVINNSIRNCSSFALYLGPNSGGFLIANDSAYDNPTFGFYLDLGSAGNSLINNTAAGSSTTGFYLEAGSDYNTLFNNTACDAVYYGFCLYSSFNNLTNNTACNDSYVGFYFGGSGNNITNNFASGSGAGGSGAGFYMLPDSCNNVFTGNMARDNPGSGFVLDSLLGPVFGNNTLVDNIAYNNSAYGFSLGLNTNNTFINDTAYGNNLSGFDLYFSRDNALLDCIAHSNSLAGISLEFSNVTIIRGHYYNNSADFLVDATSADSDTLINLSNVIFDNPSGGFQNFTNLSLNDSVPAGESYSINWSANPAILPSSYSSFAQKFLGISLLSGAPSIDSIVWSWTGAELSGYNPSSFSLWKYDASGWNKVNGSPDTVADTLCLSGISSFSTFGILQLNDTTPPAITPNSPTNLSISNVSNVTFTFTATDNVDTILNCSLYLDGAINITNASVQNGTATTFAVSSISDGRHYWFVRCNDSANNTGTSQTWAFTLDTVPPVVTLVSPDNLTAFDVGSVSFNFIAVDDFSATMGCTLFFDGTANQTNPAVPNDTLASLVVGGIQLGNHNWSVSCADAANNPGFSELRRISRVSAPTPSHSPPLPPPSECSIDTDCADGQTCTEGSCMAFICACGVVSNHQCVPYACCLDSDCNRNESCANHTCIPAPPVIPPVTSLLTPPVTPGGCNTSLQCVAEQYCNNGWCTNVTGVCGHIADHSWVAYACGPEPGCPSCPAGSDCIAHSCVLRFTVSAPDSAFVGEDVAVTATEGVSRCRLCGISWTSPSGRTGVGTTDANGTLTIPLSEKGTYKMVLMEDSTKTVSVNALLKPAPPAGLPTMIALMSSAAASPLTWLVLLLIVIMVFVLYLRSRNAGKKVKKEG